MHEVFVVLLHFLNDVFKLAIQNYQHMYLITNTSICDKLSPLSYFCTFVLGLRQQKGVCMREQVSFH